MYSIIRAHEIEIYIPEPFLALIAPKVSTHAQGGMLLRDVVGTTAVASPFPCLGNNR